MQSGFRKEVFKSYDLGRFLVIDGYIMLTERDEFIYHEMIAHVPMAVYRMPDGCLSLAAATAAQCASFRHPQQANRPCGNRLRGGACLRRYLPKTACRFDDPRVNLHFEDGLRFVQDCSEGEYDIIIVRFDRPYRARAKACSLSSFTKTAIKRLLTTA